MHLRRLITIPALLLLAAALAAGKPAAAQVIPGFPFSTPAPSNPNVAFAPVVLDGQTLFTVAAATGAQEQLPVAARASDIEGVLAEIVATTAAPNGAARTAYDPQTLRVKVDRRGDGIVLEVVDAGHHDALPVVTVTSDDAAAQGVSADALAARWQETLEGALVNALVIRQPAVQQRHLWLAVAAGAVLLLFTVVASLLVARLGKRIGELDGQVADDARDVDPARRLALYQTLRSTLLLAILLAWFGAATWAALLFPQTSPAGHTILKNTLAIALIWIVTALIDRLLSAIFQRLPVVWDLRHYGSADERARQTLRIPTIVRALNGFKTAILVFLAILSTMTQVGIPIGSVVTIGGLAAIAVSLAAQNLIRDVVSGFLVLAEDQFVEGDYVTINGYSGLVERLTLRMVQIRDGSGSLVTISNSAATSIVNHSRNWSRVDYAVSIDPAADVEKAIDLIRSTIQELDADPQWHTTFVDPVEWIGVDGLSRDGVIIRARIKTAPLRQFALQREINRRLSHAFREAGIAFGAPVPAT